MALPFPRLGLRCTVGACDEWLHGGDRDFDGFACRGIGFDGGAVDWDEWVGFWEVGGDAAARHVVWDGVEAGYGAGLSFPVAGDGGFLGRFDVSIGHVLWVHECDHAFIFDAAVAVIESVDGGIVLVLSLIHI